MKKNEVRVYNALTLITWSLVIVLLFQQFYKLNEMKLALDTEGYTHHAQESVHGED